MEVEKTLLNDMAKTTYDYIPRNYIEEKIRIITNEAILADRDQNKHRYEVACNVVAVLQTLLQQYDNDTLGGEA